MEKFLLLLFRERKFEFQIANWMCFNSKCAFNKSENLRWKFVELYCFEKIRFDLFDLQKARPAPGVTSCLALYNELVFNNLEVLVFCQM